MSFSAFQLNGKNALVTGSHRGLGAAIALALAEAGANVACHGRDTRPGNICADIQALGRRSAYFAGDLAEVSVCSVLIEKTMAEFGSLDILVNNAGIIRRSPAADYSEQDWNEVISVDLTAVFHLSQLAARQMFKQATPGKILNIASFFPFKVEFWFRLMPQRKGALFNSLERAPMNGRPRGLT